MAVANAVSNGLIEQYVPVVKLRGLNTDKNTDLGGTLDVNGAVVLDSTLSVTGSTTLSGALNSKKQVTDTGGAYATAIALTTAQSGRVILLDDAAGLDFTLPAIATADIGTHFKFITTVSITSNNYRMTAATGDLLTGGLLLVDFDAAVTAPQAIFLEPDGTSHLVVTMNGTTTGGKIGSVIEFIATSATSWFVHGTVAGDGTMVTPFS